MTNPANRQAQRHLVYFADPMCSWCWGFEPVISGLVDHFGERLPVTLIIGQDAASVCENFSTEEICQSISDVNPRDVIIIPGDERIMKEEIK